MDKLSIGIPGSTPLSPAPPPSVNTTPLPALLPPAVPGPHADDRPHLLSLRLPRSFTNAAKPFSVTTVVIGQCRPRAASPRPHQFALPKGSCSFDLHEAAENCCEIRVYPRAGMLRFFTGLWALLANVSGTEGASTALELVMTVSAVREPYLEFLW